MLPAVGKRVARQAGLLELFQALQPSTRLENIAPGRSSAVASGTEGSNSAARRETLGHVLSKMESSSR